MSSHGFNKFSPCSDVPVHLRTLSMRRLDSSALPEPIGYSYSPTQQDDNSSSPSHHGDRPVLMLHVTFSWCSCRRRDSRVVHGPSPKFLGVPLKCVYVTTGLTSAVFMIVFDGSTRIPVVKMVQEFFNDIKISSIQARASLLMVHLIEVFRPSAQNMTVASD